MTRNKKFALLALISLAFCAARISARAQDINTPVITIKSAPPASPKPLKTRFEVLHMFTNSIQVRSLVNGLEVHTFIYSDQIHDSMQKLFDQGGYQYGDKVEIWYMQGTEVALKIKGKPSKPL
ncbi:MAG: hypothetical protein LAO08_20560 [Acidobacteriia bacterium]|nr:hypothetical protein [Terriglobia bacterium]